MSTKGNRLTVAALKKENKKISERFTIDTNGYTLQMDSVFRKSKINLLISEMMEIYEEAKLNKLDVSNSLMPFTYLLTIKHFSSLEIPNGLSNLLDVQEMLINGGFLADIINAIPEDQFEIVIDELAIAGRILSDSWERIKEELAKHEDEDGELENKDELGL